MLIACLEDSDAQADAASSRTMYVLLSTLMFSQAASLMNYTLAALFPSTPMTWNLNSILSLLKKMLANSKSHMRLHYEVKVKMRMRMVMAMVMTVLVMMRMTMEVLQDWQVMT